MAINFDAKRIPEGVRGPLRELYAIMATVTAEKAVIKLKHSFNVETIQADMLAEEAGRFLIKAGARATSLRFRLPNPDKL